MKQLKWLQTINFGYKTISKAKLFVLSHEINNRWLNNGLYYCISEQRDRTEYSSLSQTREPQNTIKMFTVCEF